MGDIKALEALFPGVRHAILEALFAEPARWWSLSELAQKIGAQPETLGGQVAEYRYGGVLREKEENGCVRFQPDPGCPVFLELQAIVMKLAARVGCGETILVVEDQPATARITRILLESWGYRVLEAHTATEALRMYEGHAEEVRLLLTDVIMPGMSGTQLAEELLRRRPTMRVVFMSGYPSEELRVSRSGFLPKPFNPASLSRMVRRELDRPEQPRRMKHSRE